MQDWVCWCCMFLQTSCFKVLWDEWQRAGPDWLWGWGVYSDVFREDQNTAAEWYVKDSVLYLIVTWLNYVVSFVCVTSQRPVLYVSAVVTGDGLGEQSVMYRQAVCESLRSYLESKWHLRLYCMAQLINYVVLYSCIVICYLHTPPPLLKKLSM